MPPSDVAWWRRRPSPPAARALAGLLGLVCAVIGLIIVIRPLMSLDTLVLAIAAGMIASGLVDLVRAAAPAETPNAPSGRTIRGPRAPDVMVALGWIGLGVAVPVWSGLSLDALVLLVGIALVVAGLARIAGAIRSSLPGGDRAATLLLGVASLIAGVLALVWPDVTVLVIAVTFGARTIWFGLLQLWAAVRPSRGRRRTPRRKPSLVTAIVAVLAAVAGAGLSGWIHHGRPVVDAFYAAPDTLPTAPGALIRSEPFTRDVPAGATGWRILYSTTDGSGTVRTASALVVVPDGTSPHPVIAWTHGTTGYAPPCAPSLARQPFESGALFVLDAVIAHGWALVATDYAGLGTAGPQPYLIGEGEARSELDAVRAARHLPDAALSDKTVVWGHSQGGHAALWTGQIGARYAPDVPLLGVAALAPASDLTAFAGELDSITGGSVFASYVISAYSQTYPDVRFDRYVRPAARVLVRQMATRCLAEPGILVSVLSALSLSRDPVIWSRDPATGPLGDRLAANVPSGPFPEPVLIAQGQADSLIRPAMQRSYAARLCREGQQVDYRAYPGQDHVSLVQPGSPLIDDLISWTSDRLSGRSATPDCDALTG